MARAASATKTKPAPTTKKPAAKATKPAAKATAPAAKKSAAPKAPPGAFAGFAKDAPRFFHELASEMSREWFAEHKAEYEELWVRPMQSLLAQVAAGIKPAYRGVALAEPRIFRIHRDVRFAADKAPYKTHIAGHIPLAHDERVTEGPTALYTHFGLEEYCGSGHYVFSPEQLAKWRRLVIADKSGREIARLTEAASMEIGAHSVLTRTPQGLDPDHPRAGLLRQKGLVLGFGDIPRGLIHKPALADWLVERATKAAPVVRWLAANL
jgi:uncharacterized protein (TIGR02453 family)